MQFKNKIDLDETVEYLKINLPQLYIYHQLENEQYYYILDKNISIDKQIVQHNCESPEFTQYRNKYQIIDNTRCAEIHTFTDNVLILLLQHGVADGGYCKKLIKYIENKQKQDITLLDSVYTGFQKEYELFKQSPNQGNYQQNYQNNFEVIENNKQEPDYICMLQVDINKNQHLKNKLSQRLMLINSILKLYFLKQQNILQNIDDLLQKGFAINQLFIANGRKYVNKNTKVNFGCAALSFIENYILIGDKTVQTYCQQFKKSLEQKIEDYQYCGFLRTFDNNQKQYIRFQNPYVIDGIQFSNVGFENSDKFVNYQQDFYTNEKTRNFVQSYLFTFNNILTCSYHCPESYKNYNIQKILTILFENIADDKTVLDLWNLIKDQ